MDGIYIIRTSFSKSNLSSEQTVESYKRLLVVEPAFRSMKVMDLRVRPVFHDLERRVRANVFLCMLAYYVVWHMRRALAPILFDDEDAARSGKPRASVVRPAKRSEKAKRKVTRKRTGDDLPVHSFRTLLKDLAMIAMSRRQSKNPDISPFEKVTIPTPVHQRVLALLGIPL